MPDVTDPRERAFVRLVLTADAQRHGSVIDDFQQFLRRSEPRTRTDRTDPSRVLR